MKIRCLSCSSLLLVKTDSAAPDDGRLLLEPQQVCIPCPGCENDLIVVPELQGWQIQCRSCKGILHVSTRPWELTLVSGPGVEPPPSAPPPGPPLRSKAADDAARARTDTEGPRDDASGQRPAGKAADPIAAARPPRKTAPPAGPTSPETTDPPPRREEARWSADRGLSSAPRRDPELAEDRDAISENEILALLNEGDEDEGPEMIGRAGWSVASSPARDGLSRTPAHRGSASSAVLEPPIRERAKPPKRKIVVEKLGPRWHAQITGTRVRPRTYLTLGTAVLVTGLLALGAWRLVSHRPSHPETKYLPRDAQRFSSLAWSELRQSDPRVASRQLPGLRLALRSRTFVLNAGLTAGDVVRVNAAASADDLEMLFVYRLARSVEVSAVMSTAAFKRYKEETYWGQTFYTFNDSAIAFPESQIIINGTVEQVKDALWNPGGIRGGLSDAIAEIDFESTVARLTSAPPARLLPSDSPAIAELAAAVDLTTDTFHYDAEYRLRRVLHVRQRPAFDVKREIDARLSALATNEETPDELLAVLPAISVQIDGDDIIIETVLQPEQASQEVLNLLGSLF